jgi:hypothetical protein
MELEGQARRSMLDSSLLQHRFKEFFEGVNHSVPKDKTLWDYLLEDE